MTRHKNPFDVVILTAMAPGTIAAGTIPFAPQLPPRAGVDPSYGLQFAGTIKAIRFQVGVAFDTNKVTRPLLYRMRAGTAQQISTTLVVGKGTDTDAANITLDATGEVGDATAYIDATYDDVIQGDAFYITYGTTSSSPAATNLTCQIEIQVDDPTDLQDRIA